MTPSRLHLAAQCWRNLLPLRLPIRCRLQEKYLSPPRRQKSRRRRRRKAARPASQLPASRQAVVTTQADPTANDNSARWRATRPRSAANDRPEMRSTPVKHPLSFTSSPLSQPPIPAANQNGECASCQAQSKNLGLYKPASTDPINCGDNVEVLAVRLTLLNNTLDIYNIYRKITREQTGELQLTQLFAHASNTPTLICGDLRITTCSPPAHPPMMQAYT